jgi:hypothetical protein
LLNIRISLQNRVASGMAQRGRKSRAQLAVIGIEPAALRPRPAVIEPEIDENGGGPGVRLRKPPQGKQRK